MQRTRPRVLAAVAARLDSTRLPRKALADVAGVPLLRRVLDASRAMRGVDEVALCTTERGVDDELAAIARGWGYRATRGAELDMLARFLRAADETKADYVVRVTGDNPFSDVEYASALIEDVVARGADYGRTQPLPLGATVEVMAVSMMRSLRARMRDPNESEYLMLYAFDPEHHRCVVHVPKRVAHRRPELSVTVDTPADLAFATAVFTRLAGRAATVDNVLDVAGDLLASRCLSGDAAIKVPAGTITFNALIEMMEERTARSMRVDVDPVARAA